MTETMIETCLIQLTNCTDDPMSMSSIQINSWFWNSKPDNGIILTDDTEIVIRKEGERLCRIYRRNRDG